MRRLAPSTLRVPLPRFAGEVAGGTPMKTALTALADITV
jgi:hypothetical protein